MPKASENAPAARTYLSGLDAGVIMGSDAAALHRLWREKRGEAEPQDLSSDLIVQLGLATEELNRRWFEQETGRRVTHVQRVLRHKTLSYMAATLDGLVEEEGHRSVFEARFMLPWSFSEDRALQKHQAQLQHSMLVSGTKRALLYLITGGGQWVLIEVEADPLYQTILLQVERIFWRCVQTGEEPRLFDALPSSLKHAAVRVVDMSPSNAWAEHAALFLSTLSAHGQHETARAELKALVPDDAREALGHGVRARRSKAGAIRFEVLPQTAPLTGGSHAPLQ